MFRKLLIANRGEIALRIQRTARRLAIPTVSVASDADLTALHAREADALVRIGPAPSAESYLSIDAIIAAAQTSGADAIHPGYGFLSENADFAEACAAAGMTFVGPSPDTIRAMGAKDEAKRLAEAAEVPVVPGYRAADETGETAERLAKEADRIGYPVMVKAVAGGGGRGMRAVQASAELPDAVASARREALGAFGDGRLMLEKLIDRPRHVEVQVFGDTHGNVVHLFERDCSLQRRHQKVIEEAPAPGLPDELRSAMWEAAVALARSVKYVGAGTVEFLVPASLDAFYFIEMNTRLQVEHPVTEEITGLDLVAWQLEVAAGGRLPLPQDAIKASGHAVEARIYAEDPRSGFQPQSGMVRHYHVSADWDDGVSRIESGVAGGDAVTPFYDPMIAKWIGRGTDRASAFAALERLLAESRVSGIRTNQAFLHALVTDADVLAADLDTGLIGRKMDMLVQAPDRMALLENGLAYLVHATAAGRAHPDAGLGPWAVNDAFDLNGARAVPYTFDVDGEVVETTLQCDWRARPGGEMWFDLDDGTRITPIGRGLTPDPSRRLGCLIWQDLQETSVALAEWQLHDQATDGGEVRSPMNGKVTAVHVTSGTSVSAGDPVAVVEAMKMEHVLSANADGVVESVKVAVGTQVGTGDLLVTVVTSDEVDAASRADAPPANG